MDISQACQVLLPVIGAVALVFLCVVLKKLGDFIDELTKKVKGLDSTLHLVDESIEKVQAPLDTAVKYSHTLDKVHDKTAEVFGKAADFANESLTKLKNKDDNSFETEENTQEEKNND